MPRVKEESPRARLTAGMMSLPLLISRIEGSPGLGL